MLEHLIAPVSLERFLAEYWTKRFLHIPGASDKLSHWFPWDVLNRALEQHRFTRDRLRLINAGRWVRREQYLHGDLVDPERLRHELENGATLVFNFCEEVHPPVRELCASLERLFRVHVFANLYAGWRKDHGFNVHWDDQDNLILQIAGRKHWKIWEPTRPFPFTSDVVDTSPATRPTGPPAWEGVLEQGGVLNIPRGWWHVAYPMDEPSLHLTVTIQNLTGISFLHWLAEQMKKSDAARMPLPILTSEPERQAWLAEVWRDVRAEWGPDLIDRYLAHVDGRATPQPRVTLPDITASSSSVPLLRGDTAVQLAVARPLVFRTVGASARLIARDMMWETSQECAAAFDRLNDGQPHTVAELAANDSARRMLLTALLMKGVLRRVEPGNEARIQSPRSAPTNSTLAALRTGQ